MKRKEDIPVNDDLKAKEKEEKQPYFATKRGSFVSMMLMFCIVLIFVSYNFSNAGRGLITYEANNEMFGIVCMNESAVYIDYQDITKIEKVTAIAVEGTIESSEWDKGWCGRFENFDWGEYTMYAYSNVGEYIVLEHNDGILVFNGKNKKETDRIYKELEKQL